MHPRLLLPACLLLLCAGCAEKRKEGDPDGIPVAFTVRTDRAFFSRMLDRSTTVSTGLGVGVGSGGMVGSGVGIGFGFHATVPWLLAGDHPAEASLFRRELDWGETTFSVPLRAGRKVVLTAQAQGGKEGWETVGEFTVAAQSADEVVLTLDAAGSRIEGHRVRGKRGAAAGDEGGERPVADRQLVVGAGLDDAAAIDHRHAVDIADGREPVRDDDRGPSAHRLLQGDLHGPFAGLVEGAGGLVEDQDPRIAVERPGDREALALAPGQARTPVAQDVVQALGETADEFRGIGQLRGPPGALLVGSAVAPRDVAQDGVVEEDHVLVDHADVPAQVAQVEAGQVVAVDLHLAALRTVEAEGEARDGALAAARRPDQGERRAGGDLQRQAVERRPAAPRIGEGHVLQADPPVDARRAEPPARRFLALVAVEARERTQRIVRAADRRNVGHDRRQRPGHDPVVAQQHRELAEGDRLQRVRHAGERPGPLRSDDQPHPQQRHRGREDRADRPRRRTEQVDQEVEHHAAAGDLPGVPAQALLGEVLGGVGAGHAHADQGLAQAVHEGALGQAERLLGVAQPAPQQARQHQVEHRADGDQRQEDGIGRIDDAGHQDDDGRVHQHAVGEEPEEGLQAVHVEGEARLDLADLLAVVEGEVEPVEPADERVAQSGGQAPGDARQQQAGAGVADDVGEAQAHGRGEDQGHPADRLRRIRAVDGVDQLACQQGQDVDRREAHVLQGPNAQPLQPGAGLQQPEGVQLAQEPRLGGGADGRLQALRVDWRVRDDGDLHGRLRPGRTGRGPGRR
ncbi:hypothetical protein FGG08_007578 [Glutinoglossum americanum]|uniref:Uncharacterized protein n=1 Tax=Glutinoglossum americanum TaxID=1670608 RepID=A0A9P8KW98_9PEZI|nr:hypothetical protein FGG08_007578 [Glutinoglossum americanum]